MILRYSEFLDGSEMFVPLLGSDLSIQNDAGC